MGLFCGLGGGLFVVWIWFVYFGFSKYIGSGCFILCTRTKVVIWIKLRVVSGIIPKLSQGS